MGHREEASEMCLGFPASIPREALMGGLSLGGNTRNSVWIPKYVVHSPDLEWKYKLVHLFKENWVDQNPVRSLDFIHKPSVNGARTSFWNVC